MTTERVDFYELLELDPSVDDWGSIAERIAERREHWSRQLNQGSPAKRQRAAEQLELLRQAEEVLRDPAARAEEAEACRRRRQVEREVIAQRLEARIDLLARGGGGVCGRAQLNRLVEEFAGHFTREQIVERLRAAGVEPPGRSVRPPEVRLDDAEASKIRGQLELLRLATLYELLSLPADSAPGDLVRRGEELQRELHNATKADAATTARRDLVTRARKLFADEAGKSRYDNQLLFERLSSLDADVELAAGADGLLTTAQVEAIVAQAVGAGVSERDARAYVDEVAEEKGWRLERRQAGRGDRESTAAEPPRQTGRPQPERPPEPTRDAGEDARAEVPVDRSSQRPPPRLSTWRRRTAAVFVTALAGVSSLYAFAPDSLDLPFRAEEAPAEATAPAASAAPPVPTPPGSPPAPVAAPPPAAPPPAQPPATSDPGTLGGISTEIKQVAPVAATPDRPPRVAVVAAGDPSLTGFCESLLADNLGRYGVPVEDRASSAAVAGAADDALGGQLRKLGRSGVDFLVRVEAQVVGQREIAPLGRPETLYTARLTVTAFQLAGGGTLGRWGGSIEYGSRNGEEKAERLLASFTGPIADALFDAWGGGGGSP